MIGTEQRPSIDVSGCVNSNEVFTETEAVVRGILGRHQDLILPQHASYIIGREVAFALQEFGRSVLTQRFQTDFSEGPGMTIYATGRGKDRLLIRAQNWPHSLEQGSLQQVADLMWELRFPRGVYQMGGGGAQFYEEGSPKWKQEGGADKPFTMSYDEVVRVEGDLDEYWQNKDYNWDGSHKHSI